MVTNRLCLNDRRKGILSNKILAIFNTGEIWASGTIILSDKFKDNKVEVTEGEGVTIDDENMQHIYHHLQTEMDRVLAMPLYRTLKYSLSVSMTMTDERPEVIYDLIEAGRKKTKDATNT